MYTVILFVWIFSVNAPGGVPTYDWAFRGTYRTTTACITAVSTLYPNDKKKYLCVDSTTGLAQ